MTTICCYSGCYISLMQFFVTVAFIFHRKFSRKHLTLSEAPYKEHKKEEGQKQVSMDMQCIQSQMSLEGLGHLLLKKKKLR